MEAIYGVIILVLMFFIVSVMATAVLFFIRHPIVVILALIGISILDDDCEL
jgi:hypothetical protein